MAACDDDESAGGKTPPVDGAEIVARQIKVGGGQPLYFDTARATPPFVHRALFLPSRNDTSGLSLIRLRHRSEVWAAFRSETPDQRYRLTRLLASALFDIAREAGIEWLHFDPSADDLDRRHGHPWAHCNVREINRADYDNASDPDAKRRILTWAEKVSRFVTLADVSDPLPPPDPAHDRYRPEGE